MNSCVGTTDVLAARTAWYALRVRSNFEAIAAEALKHEGFEQFSPSYRVRSLWSDRVKWVDKPLFPGYIFCRFDPQDRLPILKTRGVVQAVGFGSEPEPVDESEIESLRLLVNSSVPLFPRAFLKAGQRVLIRHGPLAGVEGTLEQFQKGYRIVVSVGLLQRSVLAEVEAEWVEPVSGSLRTPQYEARC